MPSKATTRYDLQRKRRADALSDPLIMKFRDFIMKCPTKGPKSEKKFHGRKLMSMCLRYAHKQFLRHNPDVQCYLSKFASAHPNDIILLTRQRLSTSKIPYSQNVEFILIAINKKPHCCYWMVKKEKS